MVINKNLCKHEWNFAQSKEFAGYTKPNVYIILYCKKCAKVKSEKVTFAS